MNDFLWIVTLLLIVATVGIWIVAIRTRVKRRRMVRNEDMDRNAAGTALILWNDADDGGRLEAVLSKISPRVILDVVSRSLLRVDDITRERVEETLIRRGFDDYIDRCFETFDQGQRLRCCEILGVFHNEKSRNVLVRAMSDAAPAVRVGAAIGLAQRGQLPPLAEALERLGPFARRSSRLMHLFTQLMPGCRDELVQIATAHEWESPVRIGAIRVLVRNWHPDMIYLLLVLAEDEVPAVAKIAQRVLTEESARTPPPVSFEPILLRA